jgi:hypothetical protein
MEVTLASTDGQQGLGVRLTLASVIYRSRPADQAVRKSLLSPMIHCTVWQLATDRPQREMPGMCDVGQLGPPPAERNTQVVMVASELNELGVCSAKAGLEC